MWSFVQSAGTPTVITTETKSGVDCSSLQTAGDNVYIRTIDPPAYWQRSSSGYQHVQVCMFLRVLVCAGYILGL